MATTQTSTQIIEAEKIRVQNLRDRRSRLAALLERELAELSAVTAAAELEFESSDLTVLREKFKITNLQNEETARRAKAINDQVEQEIADVERQIQL